MKYQKTKAILLGIMLGLCILWVGDALAVDYYVDTASSGGDGTTTATSGATAAFATVAAAQAAITGDQSDNSLLFKRGGVWREQFTVGANGTSGHPFTIGAYGTGDKPVISGADVITNFSLLEVTGWSAYSGSDTTLTENLTIVASIALHSIVQRTWISQGFQVSPGDTADVVSLDLKRIGSPSGDVWVEIQGDSSGKPDNSTIANGTSDKITASSVGTSDFTLYNFTFPSAFTLSDSTQYHIVVKADYDVNGSDYIAMSNAGSGNPYANGQLCLYNPTSWTGYADVDLLFKVIKSGDAIPNVYSAVLTTEPSDIYFNGNVGNNEANIGALGDDKDWFWDSGVLYVYSITNPSTITITPKPDVYFATVTTEPNIVRFDETVGTHVVGVDSLSSSGDWFWGSDVLYMYGDPSGIVIESGSRSSCIIVPTSYVVIDSINLQMSNSTGAGGCVFAYAVGGIDSVVVKNCSIGPSYNKGIYFYNVDSGAISENNTVTKCWNGSPYGSGGNGGAIYIYGTTAGFIARYNYVADCYTGIVANTGDGDNNIYFNIVLRSHVNCIDVSGSSGHICNVYNNTVFHSPRWEAGHGIVTQDGGYVNFFNNIIVSDFTGTPTNVQLICIASSGYPGVLSDNNSFFLIGESTCHLGKTDSTDLDTLETWQSASGQDAHSQEADPLLDTDYSLLSGSPAILAGTKAGEVGLTGSQTDYFGNTIYFLPYDRMNIGADQAGAEPDRPSGSWGVRW
jgi:hypothetical protein